MPIQEKAGTAKQGSSTTFLPTSVGGCALWLDGKDPAGTGTPPSTGATVSTWVDKASGKNAAATGSPTYMAGGGINFNGAAYFLNQTFSQDLSQRSIFIIMQETVHNGVYGVFPLIPTPNTGADYQTTTGLSVETSNGLRFYGNNGSYFSDIGNATLLVKAIYNDNMNGTTGSGYLNGTNLTSMTAGYTAGTCSGYGIAGRWIGSMSTSYSLNGVIYEILFFNTPLGITDRQTIEGYLAQKWGLTASLPPNHPGLTNNYLTRSAAATIVPVFSIAPRPNPKFVITETLQTYIPPGPSAPSAPTVSTATVSNGQATVTWSAPSSNGSSPITNYIITSSPSAGTSPLTVGNVLTGTITGLTNGTAYTFTVVAVNAVGNSPSSAPSASVTPYTVSTAPTIGTATPANGQTTVTWSAPSSNGGSAITNYIITSSPSAGTSPLTVGNVLTGTITGLTNGTAYTFTVVAVNAAGSSPSSASSASATPFTVPTAPTIGTATGGVRQATVTWSAPTSNGGSAITNYIITSTPSAGTSPLTVGNVLTGTVTGLADSTAYTFTVVAVNAAGNSPSSASSASATTYSVPGAPTIGTATPDNQQVNLTWSAPASNGGSPITNYIITSSPSAGNSPVTVGNVLAGSVTGLTNGTAYTFTVVAVNAVGSSSPSAASNSATPYIVAGGFMIVTSVTAPRTINFTTTTDTKNGITYSLSALYALTPKPTVSYFDLPTRLDTTINNRYWSNPVISFTGVTATSITTSEDIVTNPTVGTVMYLAIKTTGSASNNSNTLTVTSATGLMVGMVAYTAGPSTNKFADGTVIAAVSGTTITLSIITVSAINSGSSIWFLIP